jgi:hypothetical protein
MLTGTLIGDSLKAGVRFQVSGLRLSSVYRLVLERPAGPDQPEVWSVIDFEADADVADDLAQALAAALSSTGGWYCDFAVGNDRVVVFADTVFRFPRGDQAGRARAKAHGLKVGVPEHQLDWPS